MSGEKFPFESTRWYSHTFTRGIRKGSHSRVQTPGSWFRKASLYPALATSPRTGSEQSPLGYENREQGAFSFCSMSLRDWPISSLAWAVGTTVRISCVLVCEPNLTPPACSSAICSQVMVLSTEVLSTEVLPTDVLSTDVDD